MARNVQKSSATNSKMPLIRLRDSITRSGVYVSGKREAWRRKNGRITWKHGRDKGGTLRQMREEQGRGVIRRCLFLFAPGKWEASGLTVREQLKSRRKESVVQVTRLETSTMELETNSRRILQ